LDRQIGSPRPGARRRFTVQTPVVLFAYNRLEPLVRVLERIVAAQPSTLILIADGPQADRPDDAVKCARVRACLDTVSTSGDVRRLYGDRNLGAGRRIATGLDWVFSQYEDAIVLEDDLLPDPTFFPYCETLLDRYRDTPRIGMVSGCNFQFGRSYGPHAYFFSHCIGTWGWATWRRSWQHFDFEIRAWPALRATSFLRDIWIRPEPEAYWRARFDEVSGGRADVWDYQWALSMWSRGALEVYPNHNLISHIGCLPDATHLVDPADPLCNQPTQPMTFPLSHPPVIVRDSAADLREFHHIFQPLPPDAFAPA
jgi:hypothetical protein